MSQETILALIQASPSKVARFLASREDELLAFLELEAKKDEVVQIESSLAKVPDMQARLAQLKYEIENSGS